MFEKEWKWGAIGGRESKLLFGPFWIIPNSQTCTAIIIATVERSVAPARKRSRDSAGTQRGNRDFKFEHKDGRENSHAKNCLPRPSSATTYIYIYIPSMILHLSLR